MKKVLIAAGLLGVVALNLACGGCRWTRQAGDVELDEVGPRALVKKYEWFKDMAAALDKASADIKVYEARVEGIEDTYKGKGRAAWARDDREAHRQAQAELVGLKANYNRMAAEFNANHEKINWAFAGVGNVPAGGRPLPRSYRTYLEK